MARCIVQLCIGVAVLQCAGVREKELAFELDSAEEVATAEAETAHAKNAENVFATATTRARTGFLHDVVRDSIVATVVMLIVLTILADIFVRLRLFAGGASKDSEFSKLRVRGIMLVPATCFFSWCHAFLIQMGGLENLVDVICRGDWALQASTMQTTFNDADDTSQIWRECFRRQSRTIHAEFLRFEASHNDNTSYKELPSVFQLEPNNKWHQLALEIWGAESSEVEDLFPATTACLQQSPLTHLMFSTMDGWSKLKPHVGQTSLVLRYQLTLQVPNYSAQDFMAPLYGVKECATEVNAAIGHRAVGDTCLQAPVHIGVYDAKATFPTYFEWTKDHDFIFDDTRTHFVQNYMPERRIVLFGDVPRYDVPWYVWVCVELVHTFGPPYSRAVQEVLACSHRQLGRLGIQSTFKRRKFGMVICLSAGSILVVGIVFWLAGWALRSATDKTIRMCTTLI